jgi:hypothetical protein
MESVSILNINALKIAGISPIKSKIMIKKEKSEILK